MIRIVSSFLAVLLVAGCSSKKSASYHYTQKQIEHGDLDFETRLRVDEYVNAFPQRDLAKPKAGEALAVQVDSFLDSLPKGAGTSLVQVAVRARDADAAEKAKRIGLTLVLDNSGSMSEDNKFRDAIEASVTMVSELPEGTEFALIVFSTDARVVVEPTVINPGAREKIKNQLRGLAIEGGTNIEAGLLLGYKTMAKFSKTTSSRILLLTDGNSNVGVTDPRELARKAGVQYLEGARISTVGLGRDVDENLLRAIAEKAQGAYYFAESSAALKDLFLKDLRGVMISVAKNVKVEIKGGAGSTIKKVYGYDLPINDNAMTVDAGEMNADDWRLFIVEVESGGKPISLDAWVTATTLAGKKISKSASKTIPVGSKKPPRLNRVVARNAVVFANALALIEVSKLAKQKKEKDAEGIVDVQMANMQVARSFDPSPELDRELESLAKVKQVLRERQGLREDVAAIPPPSPSALKPMVKTTLLLAQKLAPGPWGVVLTLIGLGLD